MAFYRQDFPPSDGPLSAVLPGAVSSATSARMAAPFAPCIGYDIAPHVAGATLASSRDDYSEELWQACAGPLVYVPQKGDRVLYFPQGHMEQVTALTHPDSLTKLPHAGLDSQILCRVFDRTLSAEPDTDEVFAHVTLLPIPNDGLDSIDDKDQEALPPQPKSTLRLFTKILTVSDTSTHGGFSVLRKHAEDCLPPLDMSQDPPAQDLVARDLHGKEWPFKHTYRGHPRRHLLTTGWSVFVSHKRLMAGDVVVFLRGENGQLRVGIRRAKRQPTLQQAVMSNISMHMGVVATAKHAVTTRTMFSVYYKPRVSFSSFLVQVDKFTRSLSVTFLVGMRFKMRFETEDASDRSYPGTITGIEDLDASSFPNSKWRSLKVDWDEIISNDRPERVSPWEIDLTVTSPATNPAPSVRPKRVRPSSLLTTAVSDMSSFGADGVSVDCGFPSRFPRVFQGQEPGNLGFSSLWRSSSSGLSSMQETYYPHHRTSISRQIGSLPIGQSLALPSARVPYYSSYTSGSDADYKFPRASPNGQGMLSPNSLLQGPTWSVPASNEGIPDWLMLLRAQQSSSGAQMQQEKSIVAGNVPGPLVPHAQVQEQPQTNQHHTLPYSNLAPSPLWGSLKQEAESPPTPVVAESGCKLFGISLTDITATSKASRPHNPVGPDCEEVGKVNNTLAEQNIQGANEADLLKHIKSDASSELERIEHSIRDSRTNHSTRSRVKVIKKGTMVGRGIDLSKFDSYDSLLKELEVMFNMEGELTDSAKGWLVAYHDGEGDTMKVGDDPWREFCSMVKKLYILSPEEVGQGGNHAALLKEEALQGQVG